MSMNKEHNRVFCNHRQFLPITKSFMPWSPKLLETAKMPSTRFLVTKPPATLMRSCSAASSARWSNVKRVAIKPCSGASAVGSSVAAWACTGRLELTRTARLSPTLPTCKILFVWSVLSVSSNTATAVAPEVLIFCFFDCISVIKKALYIMHRIRKARQTQSTLNIPKAHFVPR